MNKKIEAVRWQPDQNGKQIGGWPKSNKWIKAKSFLVGVIDLSLFVPTLEGEKVANSGDWVVLGSRSGFYVVRGDVLK